MSHSTKGVFSVFKQDIGNVSKHTSYCRWTEAEDRLLLEAVDLYGAHKWSLIASHVPDRTPVQCSTRWLGALNTHVQKGRWSKVEDDILAATVNTYLNNRQTSQQDNLSWSKVARKIPNRTGIQCQARWTEALDPSVRKGRWRKEEDEKLQAAVKKFGCCWIRVAESIPGRTQRQSRTRWNQIQSKIHRAKTFKDKKRLKKPKKMVDVAHKASLSQKQQQAIKTLSAAPILLAVPYILLDQKTDNSITIPHDILSPLSSPTSTLSSYKEENDYLSITPASFSSCGNIIQQETLTSPLTAIDATRILDDLDLSYSSFIKNNDLVPPLFPNNNILN